MARNNGVWATLFIQWSSTTWDTALNDSWWNVGIGTWSPSEKLDVRWKTRIDQGSSYDVWIQWWAATIGWTARNLAMIWFKWDDTLRLNYNGEYSWGTRIWGTNEDMFWVGNTQVTWNYGSVQTLWSGKGWWEWYSINGRAVFMHNGTAQTWLYNDVENEWLIRSR